MNSPDNMLLNDPILNSDIKNKGNQLTIMKNVIAEKDNEITIMKNVIAEKDNEIECLKRVLCNARFKGMHPEVHQPY
jgi:hypothetical protein